MQAEGAASDFGKMCATPGRRRISVMAEMRWMGTSDCAALLRQWADAPP